MQFRHIEAEDYVMEYEEEGIQKEVTYRFYAQRIQYELKTKLELAEERGIDSYNFLIFIIERVSEGEAIKIITIKEYISLNVLRFRSWIIGLTFAITIYLVFVILTIIKLYIIGPLTELTSKIMDP